MKRGRDDEKMAWPMFPRLHVNDTDKGGPRAPPRNKMALYEQFSIPSQRFNSGSNSVHLPGSSQGNDAEGNIHLPIHISSTRPTDQSEDYYYQQADEADSDASAARPQQRRKTGEEDDYMVPVFVQPGMDQDTNRNQSGMERGKLTPNCTVRLLQTNDECGDNPNNTRTSALCLRRETNIGNAAVSREGSSSRQHLRKSTPNIGSRDHIHRSPRQSDPSTYQYLDNSGGSRSQRSIPNTCSQQNHRGRPQDEGSSGNNTDERIRSMEDVNSPHGRSNSNSGEVDNDCDYHQEEAPNSLQTADANKSDDASDTSMVDSISGLEITPEDMVGIIGQKHFWKARRVIANQQKVFAVQVFELHRLLKVQKLIAGSPNIMLEDTSLYGKSPPKAFSAKIRPSKCIVKPLANIMSRKGSSEKPDYRMECTAENVVKTPQSSEKNGHQGSNNLLYQADQPPMSIVADPKMAPWGFHQPYGHHWLIPVMSPSEGLIYKPYPGPGFVGTSNGGPGGCLPVGSTPFSCGYMNPAFGYPPSHPYPGAPVGQNYFPTYSMPAISGSGNQQLNPCSPANLQGQSSQFSGGRANSNVQPQNSNNLPTQRSSTIEAAELRISNGREQQGNAGHSPKEREQGNGIVPAAGEAIALSVLPVAPAHEGDTQLGRVIKVVPHNSRSATASAARIFQSIQRERNDYEKL